MNIWKQIVKWLSVIFWPWFVKHAWPFIKKHVVEIITYLFDEVKDNIKDYMSKKSNDRVEKMKLKAKEAEQKANIAKNTTDSEKYRAVAQVWREVAEMLRKDNEEQKLKIDELLTQTKNKAQSEIGILDISANFSEKDTLLTIGEKTHLLPLPEKIESEDGKSGTS